MFGAAVCMGCCSSDRGAYTSGGDDAAATRRDHDASGMLHAQENSCYIDAKDSFEICFRVVDDSWLGLVAYASIADHDVEFSKCGDGSVDSFLDVVFVCDVAVDVNGVG